MSVFIKIDKCSECPHVDHMGAFGNISYVPVCRETKGKGELPYTVSVDRRGTYVQMVQMRFQNGVLYQL